MIAEPAYRPAFAGDWQPPAPLCSGLASGVGEERWEAFGVPVASHDVAFHVIREWRETYEACKPIWFATGKREEYVYFARAADGTIKIGWSRNPFSRAKSLGQKHDLLVLIANATRRNEQCLHDRLKPYRVRGEWYDGKSCVVSLAYWLRNAADAWLLGDANKRKLLLVEAA